MKIKLLIPALFCTFFSCNNIKEEDNIPTSKLEILTSLGEIEEEDSTEKQETETVTSKNASAPLMTARGSEPGWYAEFFSDHAKLVLDYGKDTVNVKYDFTNINKDKTYSAKIANVSVDHGKTTSQALVVNIESKPCTEASGETKEKTITLKYNSKEYKGCAESKK